MPPSAAVHVRRPGRDEEKRRRRRRAAGRENSMARDCVGRARGRERERERHGGRAKA
jgi:hypothetical protein